MIPSWVSVSKGEMRHVWSCSILFAFKNTVSCAFSNPSMVGGRLLDWSSVSKRSTEPSTSVLLTTDECVRMAQRPGSVFVFSLKIPNRTGSSTQNIMMSFETTSPSALSRSIFTAQPMVLDTLSCLLISLAGLFSACRAPKELSNILS